MIFNFTTAIILKLLSFKGSYCLFASTQIFFGWVEKTPIRFLAFDKVSSNEWSPDIWIEINFDSNSNVEIVMAII